MVDWQGQIHIIRGFAGIMVKSRPTRQNRWRAVGVSAAICRRRLLSALRQH
jgi:hypothetical protein